MVRLTAYSLVLALTHVVAMAQDVPPPAGSRGQTPASDRAARPSTARIRGQVVAADTGQPLRKVRVRAVSSEPREDRAVQTDERGNYEFTDLPAGLYQLTATKATFIRLEYGQRRPFESGEPLIVRGGQTFDRVDFHLPRGAVISGRVLDESGEPGVDVQMTAIRYGYDQGLRQLIPAGSAIATNDLGEYRIFGLPPGEYYVSATLRNLPFTTSSDGSGYAPTYYPGTAKVAEAERIRLTTGQTRSGVDVRVVPTRLARITGSVVDSDGRPVVTGQISVIQTQGLGASLYSAQGRPDGSFTISNLPPGVYTIVATPPGASSIFDEAAEEISAVVTVAGEDIAGVRVAGVKLATVSGRILVPNSQSMRPSSFMLTTTAARAVPAVFTKNVEGRINDDLTFQMRVRPGYQMFRFSVLPVNLALKAVWFRGGDVTDTGIEFRPNEEVKEVEIELTAHLSELSGTVRDERGQPVSDASIIAFARDSSRWSTGSRYVGRGRPNQSGRFVVRKLPPGEYYAVALDYLELGAETDPEVLGKIRDRATAFSVNEGESVVLDLKVVNGP